jgi:hypothetical protein
MVRTTRRRLLVRLLVVPYVKSEGLCRLLSGTCDQRFPGS